MRKPYPTDLSDEEWSVIEPHMPRPKGYGRPRIHNFREILKTRPSSTSYKERLPVAHAPQRLPSVAYPVYHSFRKWRIDGTWESIDRAIRERLRVRLKRDPQPSAGIVDSQSIKTSGVGGEERGYDGGKKINGRKRHLLVDTEGFVLNVKVHSAKISEQEGIKKLLRHADEMFPRLKRLWLDAGYRGEDKGKGWVEKVFRVDSG